MVLSLRELLPANPLSPTALPVFNGDDDAYGWVLDIDKFLAETEISSSSKLLIAAFGLQGPPLQWWLQWSHHHPTASWESFIPPFLWHFKPEWRPILPVLDEEDDLDSESLIGDVTDSITDYVLDEEEEPAPSKSTEASSLNGDFVTDSALGSFTTYDLDSDDSASEKCDLSSQSSDSHSDFASDWDSVVDSVDASPHGMFNATATHFLQFSTSPELEPFAMGTTTTPSCFIAVMTPCLFSMWRTDFERLCFSIAGLHHSMSPPPPKPPYRSFQPLMVEFQVTSDLTMPPPPSKPPDVNNRVVETIVPLCFVTLAICPQSVWRNAHVKGMELCTSFVYLNFHDVRVKGTSHFNRVLELNSQPCLFCNNNSMSNLLEFLHSQTHESLTLMINVSTQIISIILSPCVGDLLNLQNMVLIRINWPPIWKVFSHSMDTLLSCQVFVVGMNINSVFSYMNFLHYLVHVAAGWFLFANFETPKIEGSLPGEGRGSPTNFPSLASQSKLEPKCVSIMCVTTTSLTKVLMSSRWEGILTSTCVNPIFNVTMFVSMVHFGGSPLELGKIISTHVLVGLNFQAALDLGCEYFINIHVREKRYMCGFTMRGLNFIVLVCCFIYSVNMSAYHQLSIVKGAWSLTSTLIMGSSREHRISHLLTNIGSYLIPLVEYKNLIPSLEFFFITIPNMIPQWLEFLLIDMSNVYVNNVAMCPSWLLSQVQVVKTIGYSHEFECSEGREYLLGPFHGVGSDSKVRKLLNAVVTADLPDLQNSNYVMPFGVEVSAMLLTFSIRSVTRQQWDPGGYFHMSKVLHSFQFKQWNQGQFIIGENFYNLEDKVDFDGVGNDMIMEINEIMIVLIYSRRGFLGIVFE